MDEEKLLNEVNNDVKLAVYKGCSTVHSIASFLVDFEELIILCSRLYEYPRDVVRKRLTQLLEKSPAGMTNIYFKAMSRHTEIIKVFPAQAKPAVQRQK